MIQSSKNLYIGLPPKITISQQSIVDEKCIYFKMLLRKWLSMCKMFTLLNMIHKHSKPMALP